MNNKWINNNEGNPEKSGGYFTKDTVGSMAVTPFLNGIWYSETGRPVKEWLEETEEPVTNESISEDELVDVMRKHNCDYDDESGQYYRADNVMVIAKSYTKSKLEELIKWIEEQKITPEFNDKIIEKIKSLK